MSNNKMPTEPWLSLLLGLDSAVDVMVRIDCVGGFILTELYGMPRGTGDLDAVEIAPGKVLGQLLVAGGIGSELHKRCGVYLQHVTVASLPESYEDRTTELYPQFFRHLRLMALDPHDIALSKLGRNDQRDRDDVLHLGRVVPLQGEVLRERYFSELRPILIGDPTWHDRTLELWLEMLVEDRQARQNNF